MISPEDKKFILIILTVVVVVKIVMIAAYHYLWIIPGNYDLIGPDGEYYSRGAWFLSRDLAGGSDFRAPTNEYVFRDFQNFVELNKGRPVFFQGVFTFFIAIIYFIFGYVPLAVKGLNVLFSAFSSILVYMVAFRIYGRKTARLSFLVFTFFPSVFLFSMTMLRDPLIILCSLISVHMFLELTRSLALKNFIMLTAALGVVACLRKELFALLALATLVMIFLNKKIKPPLRIFLTACVVLSLFVEALFFGKAIKPDFVKKIAPDILDKTAGIRSRDGRLNYKLFPDNYYERRDVTFLELLKFMPKAILFYFTKPIPFILKGFSYLVISLQMLWWYVLLILSIFGLLKARLAPAYPIFIYMALVVAATCLIYVNGGLLIRHRDGITPFITVFASAGILKISEMLNHGTKR